MAQAVLRIDLAEVSDDAFLKELQERCEGRGPYDKKARRFRYDTQEILSEVKEKINRLKTPK